MAKAAAEKDYLKIARQRASKVSELDWPGSLLIYSRNKKGKTRFCTTVPGGIDNVLIVDPERGTKEMKTIDPWVWPVHRWEDLQDVYGAARTGKLSPATLREGASAKPFQWYAIDGLTKLHGYALNYVMRVQEERDLDRQPGFVQQRDYGKANELIKQMLNNFHNLPFGIIYTAQERMQTQGEFSEEDEELEAPSAEFVPDLPKGARAAVNSIVDVIGRLYIVKTENKKGEQVAQRRLWVGPSLQYDTGYRSDFKLPDYIKNPTVAKLVKLIRDGQEK